MAAKDELKRLVDVLSEAECEHLLATVRDMAGGERFWEDDISVLYNEHAKIRFSSLGSIPAGIIPAGPAADEGLFVPIPIVKAYAGAKRIALPPPERLGESLGDAITGRRSRRAYSGEAMSLGQLSTLLQHACGVTGFVAGYGYQRLPLRSFPSAGGLQAPEVYVAVVAVDGMPAGLYHFHATDRVLESFKPGNHGQLLHALTLGQPYVETAPVVFLISGRYERLRWKYGERAYRYMCMDAGFLGENLYLVAGALGLGACAIAGFADDAAEGFLGIDGRDEMVLLLVSVGAPTKGANGSGPSA